MATQAPIGAGALIQAPEVITMGLAPLPAVRTEIGREDTRTRAISLRAFNPNPLPQPLPLWKRCLCCCCLFCEEIQQLESDIEELELQLLEAGISVEQLIT